MFKTAGAEVVDEEVAAEGEVPEPAGGETESEAAGAEAAAGEAVAEATGSEEPAAEFAREEMADMAEAASEAAVTGFGVTGGGGANVWEPRREEGSGPFWVKILVRVATPATFTASRRS